MTTLLPSGLMPYRKPDIHKPAEKFGRPGPVRICLAGAGGNGSQMLARLVEMDMTFAGLSLPRLDVTVYDADVVSAANPGRQRFYKSDIGVHKAVILVHRANVGFGLGWRSVPENYVGQPAADHALAGECRPYDILITCVDTGRARRRIYDACSADRAGRAPYERSVYHDNGGPPGYWLDLGNGQYRGQVVIGQFGRHSERLLHIIDLFPGEYQEDAEDDDDGPSCSVAESLRSQDLYINQIVSIRAADLLWRLLKEREIDCQGWYVNLREGDSPMPIAATVPNLTLDGMAA